MVIGCFQLFKSKGLFNKNFLVPKIKLHVTFSSIVDYVFRFNIHSHNKIYTITKHSGYTKQNIEIMLLAKMATDTRVATDSVEEVTVTTLHESKLRCQHLDLCGWLWQFSFYVGRRSRNCLMYTYVVSRPGPRPGHLSLLWSHHQTKNVLAYAWLSYAEMFLST